MHALTHSRSLSHSYVAAVQTAVSALRYNGSGEWLASGGKDTDVVVWDVVGEAGLCRLRGHRDQVTDVVFLARHKRLVSCSKDTLVRVWDLHTQHCVQTVVGHRVEVKSLMNFRSLIETGVS
jgi:U3 small nucleolar RNA-associated protein 12